MSKILLIVENKLLLSTLRQFQKRAIGAVAHSILIILYQVLKTKQPYRELGADYLDRIKAAQLKRYLLQRLENLGLQVTVQDREKAPPTKWSIHSGPSSGRCVRKRSLP